jgi:NhaP-type Na+/H+ or K+/H+ antiporter
MPAVTTTATAAAAAAASEYYVHGSGVIGVVVYGLYGASSFLYGFSSKGMRQQVSTHTQCMMLL